MRGQKCPLQGPGSTSSVSLSIRLALRASSSAPPTGNTWFLNTLPPSDMFTSRHTDNCDRSKFAYELMFFSPPCGSPSPQLAAS